jgi:hypothetical protein
LGHTAILKQPRLELKDQAREDARQAENERRRLEKLGPATAEGPALTSRTANDKPNGGQPEAIFGAIGKYVSPTAIAAFGFSAAAAKPEGAAAVGLAAAMASDAGNNAGEAAGRAVARHAERLRRTYDPSSNPRFDPRSLFGEGEPSTLPRPDRIGKPNQGSDKQK